MACLSLTRGANIFPGESEVAGTSNHLWPSMYGLASVDVVYLVTAINPSVFPLRILQVRTWPPGLFLLRPLRCRGSMSWQPHTLPCYRRIWVSRWLRHMSWNEYHYGISGRAALSHSICLQDCVSSPFQSCNAGVYRLCQNVLSPYMAWASFQRSTCFLGWRLNK